MDINTQSSKVIIITCSEIIFDNTIIQQKIDSHISEK